MKKLHQLISEKESELQNLEDSLGLGFPIVEQAKMTQISHLRLELEDLRQIEKSIQLNDNQKIVLEWLKEEYAKNEELTVFGTLSVFFDETDNHFMSLDVIDALYELTDKQQAQVLKVFSEWALEQEEE